jgi:hypothetical protein
MLRGAAERNIKQAVFAVAVNDQHVSVKTDGHLDNHLPWIKRSDYEIS